jgi:hypothetical protein
VDPSVKEGESGRQQGAGEDFVESATDLVHSFDTGTQRYSAKKSAVE